MNKKKPHLSFFQNLKNSLAILVAFMRNKEDDSVGRDNVYNSFLKRYLGKLVQKFIDLFPVGIVLLNKQHEIIYSNKVFNKYIPDCFQKELFQVIHKINYSADKLKKKFKECAKKQAKVDFKHTYKKDGKIHGYDFTAALFKWGRVEYVFVFNDVSLNLENIKKLNQKDYELKLEKEKKEILFRTNEKLKDFKLALENSSDSIIITNSERKIEYVNCGFLKKTGYTKEEAIGKDSTSLQASDPNNKIYQEITKTIFAGKTWEGELENKKKNGKEFWEKVTISPIFNENKEIFKFVTVKKDITEEKQTKENLIASYKKLKELDDKKNEFISIASHELRTPMSVIKGYASLIKDGTIGDVNDKQKELLSKILSNTDILIELVNDMLDLSKLESGNMEIHTEDFKLSLFLQEFKEGFELMYSKKDINLTFKFKTKNDIVNADKNKLKRVITNLLGNAYKFTDNNGKVDLTVEDDNNSFVKVTVKDNGIGIPPDKIKTIFNKFSQVDNYLQRESEGTGLGLAIVKEIIEKHQGKIWVESEENKGSSFIFTLSKGGI